MTAHTDRTDFDAHQTNQPTPRRGRAMLGLATALAIATVLGACGSSHHVNTSMAANLAEVVNLPENEAGFGRKDDVRVETTHRMTTDGKPAETRTVSFVPQPALLPERRPEAKFPAVIAIARIGGSIESWNARQPRVLPALTLLKNEKIKSLGQMPMIAGVVPLSELAMSESAPSSGSGTTAALVARLRLAAKELNANMLLVYTVGSEVRSGGPVPLVAIASLGVLPDRRHDAKANASAVLIDVRSGYRYAVAEGAGEASGAGNGLSNDAAARAAVADAEAAAVVNLFERFGDAWREVANRFAAKN